MVLGLQFQILTIQVLLTRTLSLLKHDIFWRVHFLVNVKNINIKFDMKTRHITFLGCLQVTHDHEFLLPIPIDGLIQHMSSVEYRTILRYLIMIHLFPIDEACLVFCKVCLYTFREHVNHCMKLSGFKYRDGFFKDVIFGLFLW